MMMMIMMMVMMIVMITMMMMMMILIIIITLKATGDFVFQSPQSVSNTLARSGYGAFVCKARATHRAPITYNMSRAT